MNIQKTLYSSTTRVLIFQYSYSYVQYSPQPWPVTPGMFSPLTRVSDPDMHHGSRVTHVPWCIPGSLTSGFLWSRWWGKRSRHSRRMRNPQFHASGKRPIGHSHNHIMGLISSIRWHRTDWRPLQDEISSQWKGHPIPTKEFALLDCTLQARPYLTRNNVYTVSLLFICKIFVQIYLSIILQSQ